MNRVIALSDVTDFAWLEPLLRLLKAEVTAGPDMYRPHQQLDKAFPAVTVSMTPERWKCFERLTHNSRIVNIFDE